jgi:hypothetical protein
MDDYLDEQPFFERMSKSSRQLVMRVVRREEEDVD